MHILMLPKRNTGFIIFPVKTLTRSGVLIRVRDNLLYVKFITIPINNPATIIIGSDCTPSTYNCFTNKGIVALDGLLNKIVNNMIILRPKVLIRDSTLAPSSSTFSTMTPITRCKLILTGSEMARGHRLRLAKIAALTVSCYF